MNIKLSVHTTWLIMLALTILTWIMGQAHFSGAGTMLLLLFAATIKSIFIIRDFMGLRGVSFLWRAIMYGWLSFVVAGIALIYLIA